MISDHATFPKHDRGLNRAGDEGLPSLSHKGGLAERQHVLGHCLRTWTTRSPLLSHCQPNNAMVLLLLCPPNPHPIYSTSPSLLPPPTLWTQGDVTWCFFSGECALVVNSWATIHSDGKSSQDMDRETENHAKPAVYEHKVQILRQKNPEVFIQSTAK